VLRDKITRRRFLLASGGLVTLATVGGLGACGDDDDDSDEEPEPTGEGPSDDTDDGEPIKVGGVFSLTGAFALFGELMRDGAQLGVDKINADGGILGRQVELIVEDDGSSSTGASERARKLVIEDEVDFLMGSLTSADTLAVVPIATEAEVPFFYILEGEIKTCTPGGEELNPYVIGVGSTPHQFLTPFVPRLVEEYGTRWYLIGSDYVYPRSVFDITKELLTEEGAEVIGEDYAPLGTTEFGTQIDRIAQAQPDLVFSYIVGPDAIAFSLQAAEGGQLEGIPLSGSAHFRPVQFSGLGQVSVGTLLVDHYSEADENPENEEFVQAFREAYNFEDQIDAIAADTYSTIQIIKAAAEEAGSIEPDAFLGAAEGLEVATPKGTVVLDPDNHVLRQHIYLERITEDGYELVEDFGEQVHPGFEGCSVE
jgi:urea transport system substrate-binding protein